MCGVVGCRTKTWKTMVCRDLHDWRFHCIGTGSLWTELFGDTALLLYTPGWVIKPHQNAFIVTSLCDDCIAQTSCPFTELCLLRGATAVRMQWLVTNCIVHTLGMSLHRVSLQREVTVEDINDVCRMTGRYCKRVSRSWQGVKLACKHCCPLHRSMRLLTELHQRKIAQQ